MRISELFYSLQGEGQFAGMPSVFVRLTGCNLRCWFCDTANTSWHPEGHQRSWQSVATQIASYDCEHVVITGGEPLLQPDMVPLTNALADRHHVITIETAATVDRPVRADLMSISPKLANSNPTCEPWSTRHEETRDNPAVLGRFLTDYEYQLKFVVDTPIDLEDIDRYLERFPQVDRESVWLMPQGTTPIELETKSAWIAEAADQRGFRVSPRLHIMLYGNTPGT